MQEGPLLFPLSSMSNPVLAGTGGFISQEKTYLRLLNF